MTTLKQGRTRILTECAILVALSAVLQMIPLISLPNGGTVTLAAMAPIVLASLRHGPRWGLLTAFVASLVQMLLGGISSPPTETIGWFFLVVLLDYVLAYTVLGLAPVFAALFGKKRRAGIVVGSTAVVALRFLCHFLSGVLIWGVYAPQGSPVWLYALLYNGSYMLPECVITTVVVYVLVLATEKGRIAKKQPMPKP